MNNNSFASMLDETIVIPANALLKIYKDACSRKEKYLADVASADIETFMNNITAVHYLNGQADLLEVLLSGVYSKELLQKIRSSSGIINNKCEGGE